MVLTTHYMEEADYLCDRVAIIDHGKISVLDTPEALKASLGGDLITLRFEGDDAGFKDRLHEVPWVRQVGGAGQTISIVVEEGDRRVPALVAMAAAEGLEIVSVNLRQPSLEDVFLHVTGRTIREA